MLASRLGKLFPRDGHAGPDGSYRVTSLYFDTPYDTALREKLDGVDPVSYTHLDVYKRQRPCLPPGRCRSRPTRPPSQ